MALTWPRRSFFAVDVCLVIEKPARRSTQPAAPRQLRGKAVLIAASVLAACVPMNAQEAVEDPLPAPIVKGELTVAAVPFVRAPRTTDQARPAATNSAYARIQYLLPVPDGSGRLAFNDVRGMLYLTDASGSTPVLFLDHRMQDVDFHSHAFPNEAGLLGFAFHPQFGMAGTPGYGKLYTGFSAGVGSGVADYAEASGNVQESVVREWTVTNPAASRFAGTSREVLRVGQFAANHNIGTIAFNPTAAPGSADYGMLYICFGDGGGAHDPRDNGQRLATPLGAIARIDPLGGGQGRGYGIPADNPLVGRRNVAPEIWAYGLRHPQQFSWDVDGRMFIADIGQDFIEEVNIGVAGGNYGWRLREGTFATAHAVDASAFGPVYPPPETDPAPFIYPVAQYDHDEGFAISGGFVYRGEGIAALRGKYLFTEMPRGRLFALDAANPAAAEIEEVRILIDGVERDLVDVAGFPDTYHVPQHRMRVDARLGIDAEGEPYLLTKGDGWIRKLVTPPVAAASAAPGAAETAQLWLEARRDWLVCENGAVAERGEDCPMP